MVKVSLPSSVTRFPTFGILEISDVLESHREIKKSPVGLVDTINFAKENVSDTVRPLGVEKSPFCTFTDFFCKSIIAL